MTSKEQVGTLINGIYKLIKEKDSSLLLETVNIIDGGLDNKLFRAYIGYGSLPFSTVYEVMKLTAKLINDYYGTIPLGDEGDEEWKNLIEEADNIRKGVAYNEEDMFVNFYVTNIVVALIEVIEQEYKERAKK